MGEGSDYTPGDWSGHDFSAARQHYQQKVVASSFHEAVSTARPLSALLPPTITTDSPAPLVVVVDETGSMGVWPGVIFSKLPYLDHEMRTEYLGEEAAVSFAAIGDANTGSEQYPLQVRPFSQRQEMKTRLEELVIEGNGGGQQKETYELAALYYARNCAMPKAIRKPILIMIGDEACYPTISPAHARLYCNVATETPLDTAEVFAELMQKFSVHFILKPYDGGSGERRSATDETIYRSWVELIGPERIWHLPEAGRVVDVIFGLLARETGKESYFKKELAGRQKPEQVKTVLTALRANDDDDKAKGGRSRSGKSVVKLGQK